MMQIINQSQTTRRLVVTDGKKLLQAEVKATHLLIVLPLLRQVTIVKVLPQDVYMTRLILEYVCSLVDLEPGKMTFNLANAHVFYEDLEYQEEFAIDYGD